MASVIIKVLKRNRTNYMYIFIMYIFIHYAELAHKIMEAEESQALSSANPSLLRACGINPSLGAVDDDLSQFNSEAGKKGGNPLLPLPFVLF